MKESYLKPETVMNDFEITDVITTSGNNGITTSGWVNGWY